METEFKFAVGQRVRVVSTVFTNYSSRRGKIASRYTREVAGVIYRHYVLADNGIFSEKELQDDEIPRRQPAGKESVAA